VELLNAKLVVYIVTTGLQGSGIEGWSDKTFTHFIYIYSMYVLQTFLCSLQFAGFPN
jgi:hypothetical protein